MSDRYRNLVKSLRDITDLDEGRRDLGGILSRTSALARETLAGRLAFAAATVDGQSLVAVSETDTPSPRVEPWKGPGSLGEMVIETKESMSWREGENRKPSAEDFQGLMGAGSWLGTPISIADRPSGILAIAREECEAFPTEDEDVLRILADYASSAIANIRTFKEVESLSVTDELTRIYNYRFLKAALQREVERAARYGQVFSILMIDVDHLKKFNAANGHLAGSDLLRRLALILSESSRAIDLVAKYGGDEFLIILPQTNTDGGVIMGNRICEAVAATQFPFTTAGDITVSAGVASFPQHGASMEALLAAADESLFAAKNAGRNCVVTATRPGQTGRMHEAA
jgi:diguanylate cyclase (GGDEF)-like protein